jgi:hypothetical protein
MSNSVFDYDGIYRQAPEVVAAFESTCELVRLAFLDSSADEITQAKQIAARAVIKASSAGASDPSHLRRVGLTAVKWVKPESFQVMSGSA